MVINNDMYLGVKQGKLLERLRSKGHMKTMDQNEIFYNLRTDEGIDKIIDHVAKGMCIPVVGFFLAYALTVL